MNVVQIAAAAVLVGSVGCGATSPNSTITLGVGHHLTIQPPDIGPSEYLSPPSISSGAVAFDSMVSAVLPIPSGAAEEQWFYFTTAAPGTAIIRIRHSPQDPGYVEVVEVQ